MTLNPSHMGAELPGKRLALFLVSGRRPFLVPRDAAAAPSGRDQTDRKSSRRCTWLTPANSPFGNESIIILFPLITEEVFHFQAF